MLAMVNMARAIEGSIVELIGALFEYKTLTHFSLNAKTYDRNRANTKFGRLMPTTDTVVASESIALFLFSRPVTVDNARVRKAAAHLSTLTFGVYLVHDHESVRKWLWGALRLSESAGSARIVWLLPLVCMCIFAVYLALEQLRQLLFRPLDRAAFWRKPDERLREYLNRK